MAAGIFRIYTDNASFTKSFIPTKLPGIKHASEYQVALAFARDYDKNATPTNGIFKVHWDNNITRDAIWEFKHKCKTFNPKVLVSIGQRGNKYPFRIEEGKKKEWIHNATNSLKDIIRNYNLDGIDVYYEHILPKADDFVEAIGQLITNLKEDSSVSVTVASIAPPAHLNSGFYMPLYRGYNSLIDNVVYQCHTEVAPIPDPPKFIKRITDATEVYDVVLAGYSFIYIDWNALSPTVYYEGVVDLLGRPATCAKGISIWSVTPKIILGYD